MLKIDQKIVSSQVVAKKLAAVEQSNVVQMHELIERPESLDGSTFKIKNGAMDHAMYITVNCIVLNEGTPYQSKRPFEIFINTKDPNSQQWIVAITRLMSAVFRKGGDFAFVLEELKAVHDPKGGVFLPGGVLVPSIIAHIGLAIEQHLYRIGVLQKAELSPEVQSMIDAKREEAQNTGALAGAAQCPKCSNMSLVIMDGCATCLSCGDSKCQ